MIGHVANNGIAVKHADLDNSFEEDQSILIQSHIKLINPWLFKAFKTDKESSHHTILAAPG